jgi:hypothetical protein
MTSQRWSRAGSVILHESVACRFNVTFLSIAFETTKTLMLIADIYGPIPFAQDSSIEQRTGLGYIQFLRENIMTERNSVPRRKTIASILGSTIATLWSRRDGRRYRKDLRGIGRQHDGDCAFWLGSISLLRENLLRLPNSPAWAGQSPLPVRLGRRHRIWFPGSFARNLRCSPPDPAPVLKWQQSDSHNRKLAANKSQ